MPIPALSGSFDLKLILCVMILNKISLGLVDSHPLMTEGMVNLLGRKHGARILATGSKESDVIEIASRCRPDVIITELMFGGIYRRLKFHPKQTL